MGDIAFPKVPQTLKIFSKVTPGTRFMFTGKCDTKKFSFALISSSEIAILLEFDTTDTKLVSAKSFFNGSWSREKLLKNPVRAEGNFFIQIVATKDQFDIFSGGSFLFSLKYYVPLETITGIRLLETMELYRVEMEQL